jgi:hypothetical protein
LLYKVLRECTFENARACFPNAARAAVEEVVVVAVEEAVEYWRRRWEKGREEEKMVEKF